MHNSCHVFYNNIVHNIEKYASSWTRPNNTIIPNPEGNARAGTLTSVVVSHGGECT